MTFFRQIALLLPSAFLLGVLLFLLTHGRTDPGFGTYPFFEQWIGPSVSGWTPEARFLAQGTVFFLPSYGLALFLVLCVTLAENAFFGRQARPGRSAYRRSFGSVFSILFLIGSGVLVLAGDRLIAPVPEAVVAPLLVAAAPFAAGALAVVPSAIVAVPLAALRKAVGV